MKKNKTQQKCAAQTQKTGEPCQEIARIGDLCVMHYKMWRENKLKEYEVLGYGE